MSRFHSHITSATKIINTYSGGKPLAMHIKTFLSSDKKFGSKDRRAIASLCYFYYRTGRAFPTLSVEEKILNGLFLCEHKSNDLLQHFKPVLNEKIGLSFNEKLTLLQISEKNIFPLIDELGEDVNGTAFTRSFLQQPKVYLRIRPGRKQVVIDKLNQAKLTFELIEENCVKLDNNISVDKTLVLNKEMVVQDFNSQKVLDYLEENPGHFTKEDKISVWDCCAASGGKSILVYDKLNGKIKLTVSDIRENILLNLGKRLQQAGINLNRSFVADLSVGSAGIEEETYSVIICDAPCTGSGTWSRSPEQLYYFDKKAIEGYVEKQQKIVSNTINHLKVNGLFFYITCSVFKKENEGMIEFIKKNFAPGGAATNVSLLKTAYLKGYENEADTMFVAVFTKTNS